MIAYIDPNTGIVCQCSLMSSVPTGTTGYTVTPMADKVFREALNIVSGNLVVDIPSAQITTHDMRRKDRDTKMAPFDEMIKLQIPGVDVAAAEVERAAIRTANDAIQVAIDAATDEAGLRTIITDNSL